MKNYNFIEKSSLTFRCKLSQRPKKLARAKLLVLVNIFFAVAILCSCATGPRFDATADFCGVVVNQNSEPVSGYRVSIVTSHGKQYFTFTDKGGMFVFHEVPSGTVTLTGEGSGWGKFSAKKQFTNRRDITYIQIYDNKTLFEQCANHVATENFSEAERVLEEITVGQSKYEQMLSHYLKAVICYNRNEIRQAKKEIAAIEKIGNAKNEVIALKNKLQTK